MGLRVTGIEETQERLDAIGARLRDLTPVLAVIAQDTRTLIDDSFAGSRAPDGSPWAPLSPKTLARRRGGSGNPLINTSRLRNGQTAFGRGTTLSFGSNVPYAKPQQFGFTRSGTLKRKAYNPDREAGSPWTTTVPGRPFLPIARGGSGYQLMTSGPAGTHWQRAREAVAHYIKTGEVI
jgi:phage gpG-like protein